MPAFDDRLARQNRCGPPSEFPLTSAYTGIVHRLSGPSGHAPTQIHPKTSGSVDGAPQKGFPPPFTFIARSGLTPGHSRGRWTPWSVFQDGPLTAIKPASWPPKGALSSVRRGGMTRQANAASPEDEPASPTPFSRPPNRRWPERGRAGRAPKRPTLHPRSGLTASASPLTISRTV